MSNLLTFQVFPTIPESLSFLETLARNLWWSWKKEAEELFRRIDPRLWENSGRNPILFLTQISPRRLEDLAKDDSFLAHMQQVKIYFTKRVLDPIHYDDFPFKENETVAYFSMEFGIHESLPIFAGGLGILAGDHLKSASNLAFPITGIGLLYREGYFRQFLDQTGFQQEEYPITDLYSLPMQRVNDASGNKIVISVPSPEGDIFAEIWKFSIGRTPLYLLDANIAENPPKLRDTTARLYAGDLKIRFNQEVLLGIGGIRALTAMGIHPKVCHMNEGHSAFSGLERLALIMKDRGVDLDTALEVIPRSTVFTTHTPVPAGHDEFYPDMVMPLLKSYEAALKISAEEILTWGQPKGSGPYHPFSMFILGAKLAQYLNGVSKLHGRVARRMWSHLWPEFPEDEVPISHITNGIHVSTFVSEELANLFDRYLGPEWYMSSRRPENISRIDDIYEDELWQVHERNRARMVRFCRDRMIKQLKRRNAPQALVNQAESVLDAQTLTIGFSRRFATYKRAFLLLQDPDRLAAILTNPKMPVQIVFAGKAHPRDNEGKDLIKQVVQFSRRKDVQNRIIFIEDYDLPLARYLVQGTDVWLNTPRRPLEACGTSGMKAAINGCLNVSILDGWWDEGYSENVGWAIGHGEEYTDAGYQDGVEGQALYNVLENDVIPCFYNRTNGNMPFVWIEKMKASIKMAMSQFCGLRMVAEYYDRYYHPAAKRLDDLLADHGAEGQKIARQTQRLNALWKDIRVEEMNRDSKGPFRVGENFLASALVSLGELRPEEVVVELYHGYIKTADQILTGHTLEMRVKEEKGHGSFLYQCELPCDAAGRYGFTVRVKPQGDLYLKTRPSFITWA
ncbi:MAG: alpha-glucan family phosphorylase [Proteobacteria bacterium]|nr:alpha-glucan family phosphorylase [Pseudomonadota bacterium]MBU4472108.1 alpha-glucan family phosphorylase [Pseudomonadota bacterium]MCG2752893.1 alpha-glucan family phosphorylase [Desulfobacteraceae bacterium]